MSLFSQRVPLYIFLPVIVACGAAGYVANTIGPLSTIFGQGQIHRPAEPEPSHGPVATSPVAEQARPDQKELSGTSAPPRDAKSNALLPTDEVDLPTSAPTATERYERVPTNVIEAAPPLAKAMPEPPRATRAVRAVSKTPSSSACGSTADEHAHRLNRPQEHPSHRPSIFTFAVDPPRPSAQRRTANDTSPPSAEAI